MARWMMPDLFIDLARGLERCCFDYLIIEDSSMVPYTYQGSHDTYLRCATTTPKLDPAVLVPNLAQATTYLGLVPTLSVTEYPPFLLARLPAGRYRVEAIEDGHAKVREVAVRPGIHQRVVFEWAA